MTGTELAKLIRRKTKTTTTTYEDADLLVDVNLIKDEIVLKLQKMRPEIFNIEGLQDLVASSTSREYTIPIEALNKIIDLELLFESGGDYVTAGFLARRHYLGPLQESKIAAEFSNSQPKYFIRRKKVYILSETITAVTDGFKLVYDLLPADLANLTGSTDLATNTADANGVPKELHELWARRVQIKYKDENGTKLNNDELKYEKDLEQAIDDLSDIDISKEVFSSLPPASDRGDDGFNY